MAARTRLVDLMARSKKALFSCTLVSFFLAFLPGPLVWADADFSSLIEELLEVLVRFAAEEWANSCFI